MDFTDQSLELSYVSPTVCKCTIGTGETRKSGKTASRKECPSYAASTHDMDVLSLALHFSGQFHQTLNANSVGFGYSSISYVRGPVTNGRLGAFAHIRSTESRPFDLTSLFELLMH